MAKMTTADTNGADGRLYGVQASTIAYLVNRVGLPSIIVLGVFAAGLWYMPKHLEHQAKAMDSMADSFRVIGEANAAIREMVDDIQQCTKETKAFQRVVVEEHEQQKSEHNQAARDRSQLLEDHKRIMAEFCKGS